MIAHQRVLGRRRPLQGGHEGAEPRRLRRRHQRDAEAGGLGAGRPTRAVHVHIDRRRDLLSMTDDAMFRGGLHMAPQRTL